MKANLDNEVFKLAVENANDLIFIISPYKIIHVNDTALFNTLGYRASELIGTKFRDLVHLADLRAKTNAFLFDLKKGAGFTKVRLKHKNNQYIYTEISGNIIKSVGNELLLILIVRNISDKIAAEKEIKKSEKDIKKLYNLAELYKSIFIHDIANIFQNINSARLLIEENLISLNPFDKIKDLINMINDQIIRGRELITNIRKLSEVEDNAYQLKPIKINDILQESINHISKSFKQKNIVIKQSQIDHDLYILADSFLKEIFENILFNAVHHNLNEAVLIEIRQTIISKKNKKFLKIELLDNGIGIPDDKKQILFEPSRMGYIQTKHLGLGLSLTKKILDRYKGLIEVENRILDDYSKGSNFIIYFPLFNIDKEGKDSF